MTVQRQAVSGFIGERDRVLLAPGVWGHRVCFDPSRFTQSVWDQVGMTSPEALRRATPKRQGEFLAGRLAAHQALLEQGMAGHEVGIGADRAPVWPVGFEGSISHTVLGSVGVALCAVRPGAAGIGLDMEAWLDEGEAARLWPVIADEGEWGRLARSSLGEARALTLLFSAKESLFKALYPRVGRYFDFLDASCLCLREGEITLALNTPLSGSLPAGWHCTLRWRPLEGGVLTWLLLSE
nr:4'-phosphopantetheinyl transferase superfamily protein [Aeromonas schubertii]